MKSRRKWILRAVVMLALILVVVIAFEPLRSLANNLIAPPALPYNTLRVTFSVDIKLIADGFELPVHVNHAGDGSNRLFVVEKPGLIRIVRDGQTQPAPFMDIRAIVGSRGWEQGLLSVAFHPKFKDNGYLFVNYTDLNGDTVVARYQVSDSDPDQVDTATAKQIIKIGQPYPNHNGGLVKFGPDGYLYIGMGDGGSAGDPLNAGQDLRNLLGKILRIDVDGGDPYAIPVDNPYADGKNGAPEIWTYGWRNPWRFSFDRANGDMYIADVGQNAIEEVSFHKAGVPGGLNFGWRIMEGTACYNPRANCNKSGLEMPVAEYSHRFGNSITGGYVYRGQQFPALAGTYFYGDFGSSRLWALQQTAPGTWDSAELAELGISISSFGEDETGEIYITDLNGGGVYQLVQK